MLGFSIETEPHIYKELAHLISSKDLAYTIMEAGKFHDLQGELASWEARTASGVGFLPKDQLS